MRKRYLSLLLLPVMITGCSKPLALEFVPFSSFIDEKEVKKDEDNDIYYSKKVFLEDVLERFNDISWPQVQDDYNEVLKKMDERIELAESEIEVQPNPKRVGRIYKESPISIPKQESKKVEVQHISEEVHNYNPMSNKSKDTEKGRNI